MINIGLGEYNISNNDDETLMTHALGTCVAIIIHCSVTHLTGMAHIVLPQRDQNHQRYLDRPAYFAEDIVDVMMHAFLHERNCHRANLKITLIGGAEGKTNGDVFKVGERNLAKVKALLDPYRIPYDTRDTLGRVSRTVSINVATGEIKIKRQNMLL